MSLRLYLARPIDNTPGDERHRLGKIAEMVKAIIPDEAAVYDPASAFGVGRSAKPDGFIRNINDVALAESNAVLVLWPLGSRSWGVPSEVEMARSLGIPVAILVEGNVTWSMSWPSSEVRVIQVRGVGWRVAAREAMSWLGESRVDAVTGQEPLPCAAAGVEEGEPVRLPTRAYPDDAGLDVYVRGDHTIAPHSFLDVRSGLAVQLPPWSWGLLVGRSSTLRKLGLMVQLGVIDCGYRGELFAAVWNMTDNPVTVRDGDRISQLIVLENATAGVVPVPVGELGEHARGVSGFGSSGA